MISIICPYTEKEVLEKYLLKSIKKQSFHDYELILLNNKQLGMDRASEVLNYGISNSHGDIIVVSHQDVELLDDDVLFYIKEFCDNHDFGIAGSAGMSVIRNKVFSDMVQGKKKELVGERISKPYLIDVCDECFFFFKKAKCHNFCDLGMTWHFYAVEYCLQCHLAGEAVYVVPLHIYHVSPGWSLNESYWDTLFALGKKYKGKIKVIPTVFGAFPNNAFLTITIFFKRILILFRGR